MNEDTAATARPLTASAQPGWRAVYRDTDTGDVWEQPIAFWFLNPDDDDGVPRAYGMTLDYARKRLYAAGFEDDPTFVGLLAPGEDYDRVYGNEAPEKA